MQPKSTSKKSYPITGYPNNNDKKNILLSKEHLVIQISLVFLFWNSHRPLLPRMRIPSSIHKRPLYSRVEGGRKGKREAREERNGKREALASTVYIYIYIYEAFSCSREPDTGREGIKQTGRQDADGGRVGLNACGCLNRTQPRCSAISRVPVAPEMLPNSLHLRPALYSPGNALSPFLKVQEAARTAFPSLSGPCNSLSLSFSRSHLLPFPFLFSFSTSIPRATSNFLRWWRVKEGKGLSPFRHGIGIVARMHSHDDDGGNVEERDSNERLLRSCPRSRWRPSRSISTWRKQVVQKEVTRKLRAAARLRNGYLFFFFLVFRA